LGDAILKLEDEITKLIKVIGVALLKDATPDDLATISQQSAAPAAGQNASSDTQSEFGRLQRLPGFTRMQRQLFFNLMTAKPDVSEQNVRIDQQRIVNKPQQSKLENNNIGQSPRAKRGLQSQLSSGTLPSQSDEFNAVLKYDDPEEVSLDRNTIKSISRLIYERDHNKFTKPPDQP
jgi:hypothetical protein